MYDDSAGVTAICSIDALKMERVYNTMEVYNGQMGQE